MQNSVLKIAAFLLFFGVAGVIGFKFAKPWLDDLEQRSSSDSAEIREVISVGVDNYASYGVLCSRQMAKDLRRQGIRLECKDDKADYVSRIRRLKKKELQFAVATVDSDILNSVQFNYPASIAIVLSVSNGSDALVCKKNSISSLDDLKNKSSYKIAYTPSSPSEFLLKNLASHFDVTQLRRAGSWSVHSDGSEDALNKLKAGEVNCAVLWEPDISKAIDIDGVIKVLGTDKTQGMIVDVLLIQNDYARDKPEIVKAVLFTYFKTLKTLRGNNQLFAEELVRFTGISAAKIDVIKGGINWVNLEDNVNEWLPSQGAMFTPERIIDTIENVRDVFMELGDFKSDPLPDEDPYRVVNSSFAREIFEKRSSGAGFVDPSTALGAAAVSSLEKEFTLLSDDAWDELREVGTLKIRPIAFQSGSSRLANKGKRMLDQAANALKMYPDFRILIPGHTGLRGDPHVNRELSQERADSVARYFNITYGIDPNRMRAIGMGSSDPLAKKPNESSRRYNGRLKRVELRLVAETL